MSRFQGRTIFFKDVHGELSDGFCEGRYALYTSLDFFTNIWTYSSSNISLEAYFDYLCHREKILTKIFFWVLECPKIDLDNAKFTSFFDIIPANLIVVTFPILLKKRIFITGIFGKKFLKIFYFVGRGPQKTNTPKWGFLHISLNNGRM